ncbi:hypothetical protein VitviT2T_021650 [Vitis vinifera]|uniref:Uncharacterized protein n=1 Tax=Vitis vinifera TaxID=29760 RepID=A0ABY9D7L3_VITVI|nr:hypothetical protein VitviT2T_021650 [Vitis vinifera]
MQAADIVIESSKMCHDRNITTLNKSLGPKFNKLANPPENGSCSLQHMEEYKGPLREDEASCRLTDPSLEDEQGMFCLGERSLADMDLALVQLKRNGGKLYMIMEISVFDQIYKERLGGMRPGGDKIYYVLDNQLPTALKRLQFDKATILSDIIQSLKDLTAQVEKLRAENASLNEESHELTQEENYLGEEKASLKSATKNLNVQY